MADDRLATTPSPLRVTSGRIVKKYQRMRSRCSPLSDTVRRRLLAKVTGVTDPVAGSSVTTIYNTSNESSATTEMETEELLETTEENANELSPGGDGESFIEKAVKSLLSKEEYMNMHVNTLVADGKTTVAFFRPYNDSTVGLLANPRLCLSEKDDDIHYSFQVYFKEIAAGVCTDDLSEVERYLAQLLPTSGFVICPGIRDYPTSIRFQTKNLVVWNEPFHRRFSTKCAQWHVPNNIKQAQSSSGFNCCKPCKQLIHYISQLQERTDIVSTPTRMHRVSASSNYAISKLSPASQKIRRGKVTEERKQCIKKLKGLDKYQCDISDKQHAEIMQLVTTVNDSEAVRQLIAEGDRVLGEDRNALRQAWEQDVTERLEYEKDQSKTVTSKKGNRWSQITIRMALAVYSRSPAAYQALRSFKLLQLPSVRTLKYYIDANLENAGDSMERLQECRRQYVALIEEKKTLHEENEKKGSTAQLCLPTGEGSLIMDEVKVGMKLLWSSRNQKFIGHAMSHDELTSLSDVYKTLSPDYRGRQTSYFLQTLWRDFTSDFDVIGPHFSSDCTFSHDVLCRVLVEAMEQFHLCGFKTVAVVIDGASANMKMVKEMSGAPQKAYGIDSTAFDPYYVSPCFLSPFTDQNVYFIICPSHQLKNMVSALFQSRSRERGGTREFSIDSCTFGWSAIEDMYRREVGRIKSGHCSRVPKLKESYICRDSWTRLNVQPSKIMQDEVLAELREYARGQPLPGDSASVELVIAYLSSLNDLFERSLLGSNVRVFDPHGSTMQRMENGYQFFVQWACKQYPGGDQGKFLSWQTWDLLRIMYYGFRGLVEDFLTTHQGYHINPKRVNGSAVETLFSQLKHTTGGHLSGVNYEAAKATLLTQKQSKGKEEYRSTSLYIAQSKLVRKK